VSTGSDEIKKQYFTIGEVARELGLTASLIRFWETEFPEISPRKNRKGNRVYTPKDIETLRRIQYLLKERKYTIQGARERIQSDGASVRQEIKVRDTLQKLRAFLLELKESL
jgi:DNA-binding transcriptional MerR regulator